MFHFQRMASSAHIAFGDDGPGSDALDFRPDGSRVVYSMMCPIAFQDRMEAGVRETRSNAEEIQRSLQESLSETVPLEVEIFENAILGKRYGCKIFSLMREDSSLDGGDIQGCRVVYIGNVIPAPGTKSPSFTSKKSICQAYTSEILIASNGSAPLALITFQREELIVSSV